MRQYAFPVPTTLTLNDQRADYTPEYIDARRAAITEEIVELFTYYFGADSPAITAVREMGPQIFLWCDKETTSVENIQQTFRVDPETAKGIYRLLSVGWMLNAKKKGDLFYLRNLQDVARATEHLIFSEREEAYVLLVDSTFLIIYKVKIAEGKSLGVDIKVRDVLKPVAERDFTGFVLVHNHPSGDPTPSKQDLDFTLKLKAAAEMLNMVLLDHVVVSRGGVASCLDALEGKSVDKGE
jgi:DNA repair protein RadC